MRNLSPYFEIIDRLDEVADIDEELIDAATDAAVVARLSIATLEFLNNIERCYPENYQWLVENYISKEDNLLSIYNISNKGLENFLCLIYYEDFRWLVIEHPKYFCDIIYITSLNCYEDWGEYEINEIRKMYKAGDEDPVLNFVRSYFDEDEECPF